MWFTFSVDDVLVFERFFHRWPLQQRPSTVLASWWTRRHVRGQHSEKDWTKWRAKWACYFALIGASALTYEPLQTSADAALLLDVRQKLAQEQEGRAALEELLAQANRQASRIRPSNVSPLHPCASFQNWTIGLGSNASTAARRRRP